MFFIATLISWLIEAYIFVIFADVVINWLLVFGVINTRNPQAKKIVELIRKLTDPVMNKVRPYIPPIGGFDLTPVLVIFGLMMLQKLVWVLFVSTMSHGI
jgi:YggT family protein